MTETDHVDHGRAIDRYLAGTTAAAVDTDQAWEALQHRMRTEQSGDAATTPPDARPSERRAKSADARWRRWSGAALAASMMMALSLGGYMTRHLWHRPVRLVSPLADTV